VSRNAQIEFGLNRNRNPHLNQMNERIKIKSLSENVASAILADVEPGFQPGGKNADKLSRWLNQAA
jgi:hypothetical protein